jgi:hypothetical protein
MNDDQFRTGRTKLVHTDADPAGCLGWSPCQQEEQAMRRKLLQRLEKLEARRPQVQIGGIFWIERIDRERRGMLASNERIVEDFYLDAAYRILSIKERITSDPADHGWNYRNTIDGLQIESDLQRKTMDGNPRLRGVSRT